MRGERVRGEQRGRRGRGSGERVRREVLEKGGMKVGENKEMVRGKEGRT